MAANVHLIIFYIVLALKDYALNSSSLMICCNYPNAKVELNTCQIHIKFIVLTKKHENIWLFERKAVPLQPIYAAEARKEGHELAPPRGQTRYKQLN